MFSKPAPSIGTLNTIDAIVFDCDGVLTDRGLFYDETGRRILRFDARDGFGIALWCRSGLKASILSGRPIDVASKRFTELGMEMLEGKCHDKRKGLTELCEKWGVAPERVAYVGDDLPDLAAFSVAGLKIAVKDAAFEILNSADWILHAKGGHGAAREVCETLLKARGTWQSWIDQNR